MCVIHRRDQAERGLVVLAVNFLAEKCGLFEKRDWYTVLSRLHRASNQQKPLLVIGAHDAQPAAALRFVEVRQFTCPEPLFVIGEPGEYEATEVVHASQASRQAQALRRHPGVASAVITRSGYRSATAPLSS
jgi:hypothetical protein